MPSRPILINLALYQLGWWSSMLLPPPAGLAIVAICLAIHARLHPEPRPLFSCLSFGLFGFGLDRLLLASGLAGSGGEFPFFLLGCWLIFPITLDLSMRFFLATWVRLLLLAAFAPLAYLAASPLCSFRYEAPLLLGFSLHAALWLLWLSLWKLHCRDLESIPKGVLMRRHLILLLAALLLASCGSLRQVEDNARFQPKMLPEEFFLGKLSAHGIVKNRSGQQIRSFNAEMTGVKTESGIKLSESFLFDDGEKQQRTWLIRRLPEGTYEASAGDVVGTALGRAAGNAFFMDYTLRIPYGDGSLDLSMDDRMYLVNPDTLINETEMRKWGIRVGSLSLVILKHRE
ncbi:MAG: hypothetical protein RL095_593 [Verrucomicrobiota bacterium]|jgi:hypothetical protein